MNRMRLRMVLVLVLCVSFGSLAFFLGRSMLEQQVEVTRSSMPEMAENIEQRIQGFHRVNVRDGTKVWDLRATQARIQKGQNRILVDEPRIELHDADWAKVNVRSGSGQVDLKEGELDRVELDGGLVLDFGGYRLESTRGTYLGEDRLIVLAEGGAVVSAVVDLSGSFMLLSLDKSVLGVVGDVVTEFHAEAPQQPSAGDASAEVGASPFGADMLPGVSFSPNGSAVVIRAEELKFDLELSRILYRGGVEVVQGDFQTRSDELEIVYGGDPREHKRLDLDRVVARGGVVIRQKGRTAWGDEAQFLQKERKILLSGHARLQEGDSEVRGDTLTVFLDGGASVIESHPGGRVSAVLFEDDFGAEAKTDQAGVESMVPEGQP